MFEANRYPERDGARIDGLIETLKAQRCSRFVLLSTIAVLERFDSGQDEGTKVFQGDTPYGVNRRKLEEACDEIFDDCLVVRLPALFGQGLAKNFIFDLLNPLPSMLRPSIHERLLKGLPSELSTLAGEAYSMSDSLRMFVIDRSVFDGREAARAALEQAADGMGINAVMFHSAEATYQFYEMDRLVEDITIAQQAGLDCIHLAPAPLQAARVYRALLGREMPETGARLHREDMRSRHADLWGLRRQPYIRDADEVLKGLQGFFAASSGQPLSVTT